MSRSLGLVCRLLSRCVVLAAIVLMVPACAIRAPNQPVNQCAFKSYSLDVDQPDDTLLQPDGSPFVAGPSGRAPVERNPVPTRQIASQVLILSGGSEHGAFGAVVGASGVAGCGTNALVFFLDQFFTVQRFTCGIAP